ncbi:Peroxisomal membrane protein PEX16 [Nymphon striatum]|nr:Peroxisomal membrane protein PEX16 [Nymphon striatum]
MKRLEELVYNYKQDILKDPNIITDIETAFKYISYLIVGKNSLDNSSIDSIIEVTGRFEKSAIWSELANVVSNLIKVFHTEFLSKTIPPKGEEFSSHHSEKIQLWLKIIKYVQVFLELSSQNIGGDSLRWMIILIIEIVKAILRIILLLKYKKTIQVYDSVLESENISNNNDPKFYDDNIFPVNVKKEKVHEKMIILKRSGRLLRRLPTSDNSSVSLDNQSINSIKENKEYFVNISNHKKELELDDISIRGELIHVMRPLIHLSTLYCFGSLSWKPFLIAFLSDVVSLKILSRQRQAMNKLEKKELDRRKVNLLFYVLRSPFFNQYTKKRILGCMRKFSDNIPLIGIVLRPMMEYLPEWQRIYFYNWDL